MASSDDLHIQIEEQAYHKLVDANPYDGLLLDGKDLKTHKETLTRKRIQFDESCGIKFVSVVRKGTLDGDDEFEDYVRYTYYHSFKVVDIKKYTLAKIKYNI